MATLSKSTTMAWGVSAVASICCWEASVTARHSWVGDTPGMLRVPTSVHESRFCCTLAHPQTPAAAPPSTRMHSGLMDMPPHAEHLTEM